MISAGVLHRLPSERATEPFALLRVLPRRRFIARYADWNDWNALYNSDSPRNKQSIGYFKKALRELPDTPADRC